MNETDKICIRDIRGAIEKIQKFTAPFSSAQEFENNDLAFDAIALNFMVISDSVAKLSADTKKKYSNISWDQVRVFEDRITSYCLGINIDYIWRTIKVYIPLFKQQLASIAEN